MQFESFSSRGGLGSLPGGEHPHVLRVEAVLVEDASGKLLLCRDYVPLVLERLDGGGDVLVALVRRKGGQLRTTHQK